MDYSIYNKNLPKIDSFIEFIHKNKIIKGYVQFHTTYFCFFVNNNGYYLHNIININFLHSYLQSLKQKQKCLSYFKKKSNLDILPKEIIEYIFTYI